MCKQYCICVLLFCSPLVFAQSPKYEVRAVWISVASGDWPKSTDKTEQQRSLVEMFDILHDNRFNTIFFQVRPRGNVLYHSVIEPWAQQLTGVLGKDPGWDPLQFAIDEAHKRGMELHAWFNVGKVWGLGDLPINQQHVTRRHRNWVQQVDGEWWIDMGIPEAREYTERVALELVRNYDIDGIQFDFIRYPGDAFNDWKTFLKFSGGVPKDEWRRDNINAFVRECYGQIENEKPRMKVGSAPVGIYRSINGAESSYTGYDKVFQDSRLWLKEGIHDYLVPQLYWSMGEQKNPNDPDFESLCYDWAGENYGRHVYAGIGIYRDNVREEVPEQIATSRRTRMKGEAFFSYENLREVLPQIGSMYHARALPPPMMWKDSVPPLPPAGIAVTQSDIQGVPSPVVSWNMPNAAEDGEFPYWFVVYRSSEEHVDTRRGENIVSVLPASRHSYTDNSAFSGKRYFYTVTSLDRCGNESVQEQLAPVETESVVTRFSKPPSEILLSQNFPEPFSDRTYLSFEIPAACRVTLSVKSAGAQQDTILLNGLTAPGIHIVSFSGKTFPPGRIEYELKAGNVLLRRAMTKTEPTPLFPDSIR